MLRCCEAAIFGRGLGEGGREKSSRDEGTCGLSDTGTQNMGAIIPGDFRC